ncbi:hypothetical protein M0805_006418 [Coniferiporia weirii]|nr:hypothetical protein M0805_006418 [Coniferiporia weirii]
MDASKTPTQHVVPETDLPRSTHVHILGHEHHEHHHGHGHHHGDHDAIAESNRTHFDKTAHTYDQIPLALELCKKIGNAFLEEYPFDESSTVVMDFACGTGLISRELVPHAKKVIGVDISQGMIDQYNSRVSKEGIPSDKMYAVRAELTGTDADLDRQKFDVIVCSMAYHHFSSIVDITRILAFFLKPGGMLLISDGVPSNILPSPIPDNIVAHQHGFTEATIREVFESAGLAQIGYRTAARVSDEKLDMTVFVAKGTKPAVTN